MFGIVTPTYRRADGKTPELLKRCLDSVTGQTNQNYLHIIIGDKYEVEDEILSILPKNSIFLACPEIPERNLYSGKNLWCCAGGNATRYGLSKLISLGFEYLIMLDHDEWWRKDHLQDFAEHTPFAWACSKSTHIKNRIFPEIKTTKKVIPFLPLPGGVIKSSVCWNYKELPLISRNVFEATGKFYPGDKDLWERMKKQIIEKNLRSICINKITNFRDSSQHIRNIK
jgi:glycosyltransferase involved in cell wall biosynthesis